MPDDLVFLGPPRTATTSLFNALSCHVDITPSITKEIMNDVNKNPLFPLRYLDQFKGDTKVILDGSPCAYDYHKNMVRRIKDELNLHIKIIYPVRNPFDRLYSHIKNHIVRCKQAGSVNWLGFLNEDLTINKKYLNDFIKTQQDSHYLWSAFDVTEDIFIFRLDELKIHDILNFIGVKQQDIEIEVLNKMDVWYKKPFDNDRNEIDDYWRKNFRNITEVILKDLYKIRKMVNVEDWIEEANNILIDV